VRPEPPQAQPFAAYTGFFAVNHKPSPARAVSVGSGGDRAAQTPPPAGRRAATRRSRNRPRLRATSTGRR
jgi:hypothetical protein